MRIRQLDISWNNIKEDPHNLTFEVQFLGNPTTDNLRYADLKHNETLHDYLTKMGDGWQALVPLQYIYEVPTSLRGRALQWTTS